MIFLQSSGPDLLLCVFPQNPKEADAMTKVQAELDETKIILVKYFPDLRVNALIKRINTCTLTDRSIRVFRWIFFWTKVLNCMWWILIIWVNIDEEMIKLLMWKCINYTTPVQTFSWLIICLFSTTQWKASCREEKNWMIWWQSPSTWEISPKPSTRL